MIPCKHCNTLNSLDSTFCKRCGTGLPLDDLRDARAKLEKVVEEGQNALNLGRVDEAMAIAESASASDPSMVAALSLKATCHERRGQIAEALECAERIVELNPDSELDKIKRNQLRSALVASATSMRPVNRAVAVVAAFSAMVIIACAGVLVVRSQLHPPTEARLVAEHGPQRFDPNQVQYSPPAENTPMPTPPQGQPPAGTTQVPPLQAQQPATGDESDTPRFQAKSGNSLPSADGGEVTIPPAGVEVTQIPPDSGSTNTSKVATGPGPTPIVEPEQPGTQTATAQAHPDPGEIQISLAPGSQKRTIGGSSPVGDSGADSAVYAKAAQQDLLIGNYSSAATKYERAIQSGGDAAMLGNHLGQAYSHLGRKSDAIAAYQRVISAADSAIRAGKGDANLLKAQRDAAQAALNSLQGG